MVTAEGDGKGSAGVEDRSGRWDLDEVVQLIQIATKEVKFLIEIASFESRVCTCSSRACSCKYLGVLRARHTVMRFL